MITLEKRKEISFYPDLSEFDNNPELKEELEMIRMNFTKLTFGIDSDNIVEQKGLIELGINGLRNNSNNCLLFSSGNEKLITNFKETFNKIVDLYKISENKVSGLKVEKMK